MTELGPRDNVTTSPLGEMYARQAEAARAPYRAARYHPARMGLAFALQVVTAILGPVTLGYSWTPIAIVLTTPTLVLSYDLPWLLLSTLIIVLGYLALSRRYRPLGYAAGLLGLLAFRFFYIGTVLSLLSLGIIWMNSRCK